MYTITLVPVFQNCWTNYYVSSELLDTVCLFYLGTQTSPCAIVLGGDTCKGRTEACINKVKMLTLCLTSLGTMTLNSIVAQTRYRAEIMWTITLVPVTLV